MDKKLLHLQIEHLFENIKFRYDLIKKYESTVSNLDIDGLKDKIRELYDQIIQLELLLNEHGKTEINKPDKQKEVNIRKPDPKKIVKENKNISSKEVKVETEDKIKPKIEEKEIVKKESRTKNPVFEKKTIVADKFVADDDKTIAAKIKKNPIMDLKKAIGINDKFLFIKELFNNDLKDYARAIDGLNELSALKDVQSFIDKLSKEYNWDRESEHVLRLKEIVERKLF